MNGKNNLFSSEIDIQLEKINIKKGVFWVTLVVRLSVSFFILFGANLKLLGEITTPSVNTSPALVGSLVGPLTRTVKETGSEREWETWSLTRAV